MITQDELKNLLYYCQETGVFICKKARGRLKVGDISGNKMHDGYMRMIINNKHYSCHRIAWLYVYGNFPKNQIDHINGIKDDNRICNLREATASQNAINKGLTKKNTSKLKGITYIKKSNKWQAQARLNNKSNYLGLFESKEKAYKAYCNFSKKYHGEFARLI
jgi:hypothetical protein